MCAGASASVIASSLAMTHSHPHLRLWIASLAFAMTNISGVLAENAPPRTAAPPPAAAPAAASASPAELISKFRLQHGEGKVVIDATLNKIARAQAEAMAAKDLLEHDALGPFNTRVAPAKAGLAAENIAYGYTDFPRTLTQWINSSGHRKNLLLHDATRVGIASALSASTKRTYWAMVIAGGYESPKSRDKSGSTGREPLVAVVKPAPEAKRAKSSPKRDCGMRLLGVCLY